jgi:preprotein translocase subunit SecE
MSLGRRSMRGGPAAGSGRMPEGGKLVTSSPAKNQAEKMRAMMTPSRPGSGRLLQERLSLGFFQDAIAEIRKVHWPTREQARNLTSLVIAVSLALGVLLGAVDYVFEKLFELVLRFGA